MTERELIKRVMEESFLNKEQLRTNVLKTYSHRVSGDGNRVPSVIRRIPAAILVTIIICFSSITVFAVGRFLYPREVALMLHSPSAASAFDKENSIVAQESITEGGYTVTFLGIASGKNLNSLVDDTSKSYAVVAITKSEGSPIANPNETDFFVSPLIHGLDPSRYNIASMKGRYTKSVVDGVLYYLIECDDIETFADRGLYICVTKSTFYDRNAFVLNEDGSIIPAPHYTGLNALFTLPIDPAKADRQRANNYIANGMGKAESNDSLYFFNYIPPALPMDEGGNADVTDIMQIAEPIADSRQMLTMKPDGTYLYAYESVSEGVGSESIIVAQQVDDEHEVNSPFLHSISSYEGETTIVWYLICTKWENGILEAVTYEEKR